MKKFFFFFLITLSACLQAETLTEVIQRTLETNPDVLITINNRRAIDQELKQAQAGYWPSVELTGA
jgi:adhesin transport system outer membrane protein